ncbi:Outer membrane efflux protein [Sulfurimonas denitrificans DSM 1251]|uniref:Outer membrane efflux protein n=1 Tax=Sulfurimonas denitrificans (strain ATCC 33889 / DSM 1251) TaxID=326298 RepID=Q30QU3_SULDN|nr:TolC family protein [Sulfurimonas denitrificans]ABB44638.1 Outer membrane efflux protein [Sulfurimonas denitrificans DSM 1251]MDD3442881.1 TolC family protein [Sulfurimonas denitrificans]
MSKFLALFLALFGLGLHAQTLTLETCIEKSLRNHPDIKKLSLFLEQSSFGVDVAKADYLPQVNLSADYNPHNTFVMPQNGAFKTITGDSWQVGAQINQKIYDFSKTTSTIKANEKSQKIASLSLKDAEALLGYNIKNIYNLALFQTKALQTRERDYQTKEELYKQAAALVREGLKTQADEMSMLSALYSADDARAQSKAELHKALTTLSLYMGEKVEFDATLKDNSIDKREDFKTTKEDVMQKNYALSSAQELIKRDTLLYSAVKAQNYGSLDAVASYTRQSSLNEYDASMVGIGIKIPIYSGGRISAQEQISRIDIEMAKEAYNTKKLQLQEEIDNLLIDLQRFHYTTKAKEALIDSTLATKTIVEARYKEGLSTYIEVLDASSLNLQATLGLLESKFAIQKIMDRLEYLRGESE